MGQGRKSAVGGGMGIATDHGHARERRPLLRPHHVDDALAGVAHTELKDSELIAVRIQRFHLDPGDGIGDALDTRSPIGGGHVVIGGGQVRIDAPGAPPGEAKPFKGLGGRHFMQ